MLGTRFGLFVGQFGAAEAWTLGPGTRPAAHDLGLVQAATLRGAHGQSCAAVVLTGQVAGDAMAIDDVR
jgi:hypothetical protein